LQQAVGKYLVFSGRIHLEYTHNAYDFSILGNTPIFFPLLGRSKIPDLLACQRTEFPRFLRAYGLSSVAARSSNPNSVVPGHPGAPVVFRIDHDEKFNQTTHLQLPAWKKGPWVRLSTGAMTRAWSPAPVRWRDSSGSVDLSVLTADQQLKLASLRPTPPTLAHLSHLHLRLRLDLISLPPRHRKRRHNPPRIASRNLST